MMMQNYFTEYIITNTSIKTDTDIIMNNEFIELLTYLKPYTMKIVGLLLMLIILFLYSKKAYRFLVNSSPKKELVKSLLKERVDLECSTTDVFHCELLDNYKKYRYDKLFPDAVCELNKRDASVILKLWDELKTSKMKKLTGTERIKIIDQIIDRLTK